MDPNHARYHLRYTSTREKNEPTSVRPYIVYQNGANCNKINAVFRKFF